MKSVLPTTKFKLQAPASPRQQRLQVPLNGHPPPTLSKSVLKDPQSGSQAAKLLGRLDQLSRPRALLFSSPISASPHYGLPEIPRYIFSAINRGNQKLGSGFLPDLAEKTMRAPKRLSSSLMTWSPFLLWEAPFGSMLTRWRIRSVIRPGHRANNGSQLRQ